MLGKSTRVVLAERNAPVAAEHAAVFGLCAVRSIDAMRTLGEMRGSIAHNVPLIAREAAHWAIIALEVADWMMAETPNDGGTR